MSSHPAACQWWLDLTAHAINAVDGASASASAGAPRTAELSIDRVQLSDEALYRCRVDFKTSRSRNYQVNLTVIGKLSCKSIIYA